MSRPEVATFVAQAEERGCVQLSELDELVRALGVDDEDVDSLESHLESLGIEISDDCGRAGHRAHRVPQRRARRRHHRRAPAVPERDPPLPAADRGRGGRAGQAHRARRPGGQGADDQLQPAPGRLDRQEVPGPGAAAARPDPGGHLRPDPRRREVRLAQGLQVLDLRDLLDPPGDPARARQQGAHDPHPGAHRPARAQDRARGARAPAQAWAASRPTRRSPRRPSCRSSRSQEVRDAARTVTSLDRPVGEDGDTALGDLLAATTRPAWTRRSTVSLAEELLRRTVEELPEDERKRDPAALRHRRRRAQAAARDRPPARAVGRARPPARVEGAQAPAPHRRNRGLEGRCEKIIAMAAEPIAPRVCATPSATDPPTRGAGRGAGAERQGAVLGLDPDPAIDRAEDVAKESVDARWRKRASRRRRDRRVRSAAGAPGCAWPTASSSAVAEAIGRMVDHLPQRR